MVKALYAASEWTTQGLLPLELQDRRHAKRPRRCLRRRTILHHIAHFRLKPLGQRNGNKLSCRGAEYFDFFEARGIGVINASPFSMGLLSMRGAPDWHPATTALREACAKAARYCDEQGYPIESLPFSIPRHATSILPPRSSAVPIRRTC